MMRKRALVVIGVLLFCLSQIGVNYLIYKHQNNIEIPKVQLRDVEENKKDKKKTFAIMLEQDDGSYVTASNNSFDQPGYMFNTDKSGCIDMNGNKIANSLSYNNSTKSIVVSVSSTAYCYAYFDQVPNLYKVCGSSNMTDCASSGKLSTVGNLWQSGLDGDGYRYYGTNPDNYICFGATDKTTCIGNTDAYMYRIIGVFESGGTKYMKLIKKEALNTTYVWNANYQTDVNWGTSDLYKKLNDTETGSTVYLKNTTYMPAGWGDRIKSWTWNTVNTKTWENNGLEYHYNTVKNVYLHEIKKGAGAINCKYNSSTSATCTTGSWTTATGKIGLMYVSDYLLGLGTTESLEYNSNTNQTNFKGSWIHLLNNDLGVPNSYYEWTLSRYGHYNQFGINAYYVWCVRSEGYVTNYYPHVAQLVRPVFYLNSNQVIKSGTGSLSDPFLLK